MVNRTLRDEECFGDLSVGEPLRYQLSHLPLATGEGRRRYCGRHGLLHSTFGKRGRIAARKCVLDDLLCSHGLTFRPRLLPRLLIDYEARGSYMALVAGTVAFW